MSNLISIVGDPHIVPKNIDKAIQLFNMVEELGHTTVWLGDLQDTKEVIRGKIINLYYDYFKSSKLNHIVLVGNHDWFNLECHDHGLRVLKELPNVTIVDSFTSLPEYPTIGFMPYKQDQTVLKGWLKLAESDKLKVIFGHFDVVEFDYGNGRMCEEGLILKDFKAFDKVVSGHFHKYQLKKNLMYLGTPFSHSFGEANQPKYLATLNIDTLETLLIPTRFPLHIDLTVDLESKSTELILHQVNYHRIFLKGTNQQISEFDRSPYKDYDIRWIPQSTDEINQGEVLKEGGDNKQQFVQWATEIRKLDKETVDLGLSILGTLKC